jgi:hypothetical protein
MPLRCLEGMFPTEWRVVKSAKGQKFPFGLGLVNVRT